MNKLLTLIVGALMLGVVGCMEEEAYADPPYPPSQPNYGCVVVEDEYGEREVCDTSYYVSPEGVIYLDTYYNVWMGAGGFWYGGVWHYGYWPGYWERYHTFYHGHGFYNGYSHGYYGHHFEHGTFHGGGYHGGGGHFGGYHGGGGHSGGGHGGHR